MNIAFEGCQVCLALVHSLGQHMQWHIDLGHSLAEVAQPCDEDESMCEHFYFGVTEHSAVWYTHEGQYFCEDHLAWGLSK